MKLNRSLIAVWVLLFCASTSQAWWNTGHGFITQSSLQHLPAPLQSYVNENFARINQYARNEPPGQHYIDIDAYSEFHADGTFPRDLNVLYAKYGASLVNSRGTSPWTIANYRQTLTAQIAGAQTVDDWVALGRTAGEMAHYIEDIHQPLHTTQNFNGGMTGNFGIHARYEGTMIEQHFADLAIAPAPNKCVYIPNTVDTVLTSIDTTWQYVTPILNADTVARGSPQSYSTAYYNAMFAATGGFTHTQFQLASQMVASLWYSAWVDAGSPTPVHVPEPSTLLLAFAGSLICALRRRRVAHQPALSPA